ncbi:TBCD protein [Thelephora terrestris]|uniref:TBCD protein n=1 Tax=Thelephora terrestris TaxID=56493 RepID=A0A9P6H778_9AGAM|nr:TBCD protein [Thelephora terrestris]
MNARDDNKVAEGAILTKFERREWFLENLRFLLSLDLNEDPSGEDSRSESLRLHRMEATINSFQEQPYLLDPYLEEMVLPITETIKSHVKALVAANPGDANVSVRFTRVCSLLYTFIKFRGCKTIVRFFPHEVADLTIVLDFFKIPLDYSTTWVNSRWQVFYSVTLWLSLVCMIPFGLDQFDEVHERGKTAEAIEGIAKRFLCRSGVEREGAALVLSRLYTRADTKDRLDEFMTWGEEIILESTDLFLAVGILQVVCEIAKTAPSDIVQAHSSDLLRVARSVDNSKGFDINAIVRKLKTKAVAHTGIRLLPPRAVPRFRKGKSLVPLDTHDILRTEGEEQDVPEEMEGILEDLFQAIQDKDTVVRWAAAKGIGRISERLPSDFSGQVLETVMSHFEIHSVGVTTINEMPSIAEPTWQGACLTCAEMARRGLISDQHLPVLLGWLSKAIYFDIPKGSHSVGSSVRDAASYVLWSLARAHDPKALAPHASGLAKRLITVALFDREVHIRRAASAAFQEHVGRNGLFPDGIDILRKADFYSVGTRRNAFLIAAPQVGEHIHYRPFLIDHLFDITLRHFEFEMRVLGAQSLRAISELDLAKLGPENAARAAKLLSCADVNEIHGGLVALNELASCFKSRGLEEERQQAFRYLSELPTKVLQGTRNEMPLAAACDLIGASISSVEITLLDNSSVPNWRSIIEAGLRNRSVSVQESATKAFGSVSQLVDCSDDLTRLIRELRAGLPPMQQSLGTLVGVLDYKSFPHGLENALAFILESVDRKSPRFLRNIEARRNCYDSLPLIFSNVQTRISDYISPKLANQCFDALLEGLTDYTTDERGDVGSWIRISCVHALSKFVRILFIHSESLPNFVDYLPPEKYHTAVGGILKQGVERLDNVRQQAGVQFLELLRLDLPEVHGKERWRIFGNEMMNELFSSGEGGGWNDATWLYPKAVHFLKIPEYRDPILMGLVLSLGTKTESTHRPVSSSLVEFVQGLAPEDGVYPQVNLTGDLVKQLKTNFSNNNIFIPLLQTSDVLLESGALDSLNGNAEGEKQLRGMLSVVTRSIPRIKNISRIQASMKVAVDLLAFPALFAVGLEKSVEFLLHQFPTIRTATAEHLYLVMQSKDLGRETDGAEDVLLETEWSVIPENELVDVTKKLLELLS